MFPRIHLCKSCNASGRQYGRGVSGGQVRDEFRTDYDPDRGGYGFQKALELLQEQELERLRKEQKEARDDDEDSRDESREDLKRGRDASDDSREDSITSKRRKLDNEGGSNDDDNDDV